MIRRILVGISDRLYSLSAALHAVELAKRTGASLTAVSVLDNAGLRDVGPVALGAGPYATELRRDRLELAEEVIGDAVDAFERVCSRDNIPYEIIREDGDPMNTFVDVSRYHDLMVVGLHRLFEHGVIEDPTDQVAKLISSGVRPIFAVAPQQRMIKRVLIAYSGSVESAKTLRSFVQMQPLWDDLSIRVVHFGSDRNRADRLFRDTKQYLNAYGLQADFELANASPKHLLAYAEEWNADMIVLGNSAKSLLLRKMFGETALQVMRESNRPLFLSQ